MVFKSKTVDFDVDEFWNKCSTTSIAGTKDSPTGAINGKYGLAPSDQSKAFFETPSHDGNMGGY